MKGSSPIANNIETRNKITKISVLVLIQSRISSMSYMCVKIYGIMGSEQTGIRIFSIDHSFIITLIYISKLFVKYYLF